jgi:hypothetical protein
MGNTFRQLPVNSTEGIASKPTKLVDASFGSVIREKPKQRKYEEMPL